MLTKAFGMLFFAWLLTVLAVTHFRTGRRPRRLAAEITFVGGLALVVGGWWWLRNLAIEGQLQPSIALRGVVPTPGQTWGRWRSHAIASVTRTFWGDFGWYEAPMPVVLTSTATVVCLAGVLLALWRRQGGNWLDRARFRTWPEFRHAGASVVGEGAPPPKATEGRADRGGRRRRCVGTAADRAVTVRASVDRRSLGFAHPRRPGGTSARVDARGQREHVLPQRHRRISRRPLPVCGVSATRSGESSRIHGNPASTDRSARRSRMRCRHARRSRGDTARPILGPSRRVRREQLEAMLAWAPVAPVVVWLILGLLAVALGASAYAVYEVGFATETSHPATVPSSAASRSEFSATTAEQCAVELQPPADRQASGQQDAPSPYT